MGMGKQLEKLLQDRNMNVNEFATILGIRAQRLYNIIQRDTKKVQTQLVKQIADTLGVPVEYFYSNESISEFIDNNIEMEDDFIRDGGAEEYISSPDNIENEENPQETLDYMTEKGMIISVNSNNKSTSMSRILLYSFQLLNETGKKELLKRIAEMTRLQEYIQKDK